MDTIRIEGLELFCHHGVFPEENRLGQKFVVSAVLYTDTRKAGKTDALEDSIHYGEVAARIQELMQQHTYKLLERAAEFVCERLLLEYEALKKITLRLEKPWAPVGLPLQTVAVEITRQWHQVYLSIGSNMGDKKENLLFGIQQLNESEDTKVVKQSDFLVTEPYGYEAQDEFLNACLEIRTLKTPYELLDEIHRIEKEAGRVRKIHWGPRTLDLDILFYDKLILEEDDLIIPHKEIPKRQFVLKPLVQIAPNFRHPISNFSVEELYENLTK